MLLTLYYCSAYTVYNNRSPGTWFLMRRVPDVWDGSGLSRTHIFYESGGIYNGDNRRTTGDY